jgi:hypothetical protein
MIRMRRGNKADRLLGIYLLKQICIQEHIFDIELVNWPIS